MSEIFWILGATVIVSLASFVGIFTFAMKEEKLLKILQFLVAFSAGTMMGGAFLNLLPEAADKFNDDSVYLAVVVSFAIFFLVEKFLHWRHCHKEHCEAHTFGYLNLLGDGLHNFIDGLIIAAAFMTDIRLGVIVTITVALHEIPQEIGDFGVLLYAGFKKWRAVALNFVAASTIILGGVAGYFLSFYAEKATMYLLSLAAGGFIYIAAADLLPELKKETVLRKSVLSFLIFFGGIIFMYLIKIFGGE